MAMPTSRRQTGGPARPGTGAVSADDGGIPHSPASRPAGHRSADSPVPGFAGTGLVADELWLLGHDDRTGKSLLQPRALGTGLAGALLAELMLAGWITLRAGGAVVITRSAPAEAVRQHPLLRLVAGEPGPAPVSSWLRFLAAGAARQVAGRLEEAGYLQPVRSRLPQRQVRWVPVNPDWAIGPMLRVRSALDPAQPLSARAAALTGLAVACGLGFRLNQLQAQAGPSSTWSPSSAQVCAS